VLRVALSDNLRLFAFEKESSLAIDFNACDEVVEPTDRTSLLPGTVLIFLRAVLQCGLEVVDYLRGRRRVIVRLREVIFRVD